MSRFCSKKTIDSFLLLLVPFYKKSGEFFKNKQLVSFGLETEDLEEATNKSSNYEEKD